MSPAFTCVIAALLCVSSEVGDRDVPETTTSMDGGSAVNPESARGRWLESFEEARTIAQSQQLPLVLHFEADWCGACRSMDSTVLNQPSVVEKLGKVVVAVRIDADRDPGLISQYNVASLPTEVILRPDGTEIGRYVGGTSLTDYLSRLDQAGQAPASSGSTEVAEHDELTRPCLLVHHDGRMVGLGGYSPVAMRNDRKWIQGSADITGIWKGVEYYFQSAEEREQFFARPDDFIPQLHGCDPVELQTGRRAEAGAIELGAFYKGRLFFFLNEENRRRFRDNPSWYAEGVPSSRVENADEFPFLKALN